MSEVDGDLGDLHVKQVDGDLGDLHVKEVDSDLGNLHVKQVDSDLGDLHVKQVDGDLGDLHVKQVDGDLGGAVQGVIVLEEGLGTEHVIVQLSSGLQHQLQGGAAALAQNPGRVGELRAQPTAVCKGQ